MKPLNGYIQIELEKGENTTESGLITKAPSDDKTELAEVIDQGDSDIVSKGDKVAFKSYSLVEVEVNNEKLYFIQEGEILAKQ